MMKGFLLCFRSAVYSLVCNQCWVSDADIIFGCACDVNISSEELVIDLIHTSAALAVSESLEIHVYCL